MFISAETSESMRIVDMYHIDGRGWCTAAMAQCFRPDIVKRALSHIAPISGASDVRLQISCGTRMVVKDLYTIFSKESSSSASICQGILANSLYDHLSRYPLARSHIICIFQRYFISKVSLILLKYINKIPGKKYSNTAHPNKTGIINQLLESIMKLAKIISMTCP